MLKITAIGRVGRDAELRATQSGTQVLGFSLGCTIGYGDKKSTEWVDCAIFGDRAAKLQQYITKGAAMTVFGRPSVDTWIKDGEARHKFKVAVEDFEFQGGGKSSDGDNRESTRTGTPAGNTNGAGLDDEIPF